MSLSAVTQQHYHSDVKVSSVSFQAQGIVALSPDQIFRTPCELAENRVWTLSIGKLGQVDIRLLVIVSVNYFISSSSICFGAKKSASWLSVTTTNVMYFT